MFEDDCHRRDADALARFGHVQAVPARLGDRCGAFLVTWRDDQTADISAETMQHEAIAPRARISGVIDDTRDHEGRGLYAVDLDGDGIDELVVERAIGSRGCHYEYEYGVRVVAVRDGVTRITPEYVSCGSIPEPEMMRDLLQGRPKMVGVLHAPEPRLF